MVGSILMQQQIKVTPLFFFIQKENFLLIMSTCLFRYLMYFPSNLSSFKIPLPLLGNTTFINNLWGDYE